MKNVNEGHSNHPWDELKVGDTAAIERTVTARELYLFAHASGNLNPMHQPGADVDGDGRVDTVAPSMWIGALVSTVLGNVMPGPGTLLLNQQFDFAQRARLGDRLRIGVEIVSKAPPLLVDVAFTVTCIGSGIIAQGKAQVRAPAERIVTPWHDLPVLLLDEHDHFEHLISAAADLGAMTTAVVCPDDALSLGGALLSRERGLIVPVLIGDAARIAAAAEAGGHDISALRVIDQPNHSLAAAQAVAMVHTGEVKAIMKGNLHSDELLAQVVKKEGGLRAGRRVSHVFVMDVPTLDHPLFVSDAAINIAPDLATKVDITQNAIDLARACGVERPTVAILSAVETVNLNIPSSMDAAILAKMSDRGQITGGVVDGPLAMDNAIDMDAARVKKLHSPVAGVAQVLIVPSLESGNMLAKQLTFVSRAQPSGLVVGAQVPVMLTSRADNDQARLASCALALLYAHYRREGRSAIVGKESRRDDAAQ